MKHTEFALAKDDIESMRENLCLRDLPYIDLTIGEEQSAALKRWPLLAELSGQAVIAVAP